MCHKVVSAGVSTRHTSHTESTPEEEVSEGPKLLMSQTRKHIQVLDGFVCICMNLTHLHHYTYFMQ